MREARTAVTAVPLWRRGSSLSYTPGAIAAFEGRNDTQHELSAMALHHHSGLRKPGDRLMSLKHSTHETADSTDETVAGPVADAVAVAGFSAAEVAGMEAALEAARQGPRGANPLVG